MTPEARYLQRALRVTATGLAVLVWFNLSADAFGIYRRWHLPHWRTEPEVWSRVSAAERIADDCNVVFMGSSRVVHGFGAHIPRWGTRSICNGALAGTSIQEQRVVFDWVLRQPAVRQAVFFLDFHMFHSLRGTHGDFTQSRFNTDRSRLTYHLWATTSFDATKYGFRAIGRPLPYVDEIRPPISQLKANRIELYRFFRNPKLYGGWQGDDETMGILTSMFDDADARNIRVIIVIPPIHAILLETEAMMGVWDAGKDWKRELVARATNRAQPVPVWDFTTYSPPVVSRMPLGNEDPLNPWWTDVSHQSLHLGFMTMSRITEAYLEDGGDWDEDFGVVMTPDSIEAHFVRIEAARERWRTDYADQLAWLQAYSEQLLRMEAPEFDMEDNALAPGEFNPALPGEE